MTACGICGLTGRPIRHEFESGSPGFISRQILRILERSRRIVFIQVGPINGVSEGFTLYPDSPDRDLAIRSSDRPAWLSEEHSVPTGRLHTPGSDKDAVFDDHKPDADEAMRTRAGPNAQTRGFSKSGQHIIGESSARFHLARITSDSFSDLRRPG